jgi:hypothetical protein
MSAEIPLVVTCCGELRAVYTLEHHRRLAVGPGVDHTAVAAAVGELAEVHRHNLGARRCLLWLPMVSNPLGIISFVGGIVSALLKVKLELGGHSFSVNPLEFTFLGGVLLSIGGLGGTCIRAVLLRQAMHAVHAYLGVLHHRMPAINFSIQTCVLPLSSGCPAAGVPQQCLVIQNILASVHDLQHIDQTFPLQESSPRCFQVSFPQQLLYSTQCLPGCMIADPYMVPPTAMAYATRTPPGCPPGLRQSSVAATLCMQFMHLLRLPCKSVGYLPGVREPTLNGCGEPLPVHVRFGGA